MTSAAVVSLGEPVARPEGIAMSSAPHSPGLCQCGCGQETTTYRDRPRKYVHGHNGRRIGWHLSEKACSQCGEVKPLLDFFSMGTTADGKRPDCKACLGARHKQYRASRPHYGRERYQLNPEKHREWARISYKRHRDKRLAGTTAWRAANPDKVREITRKAMNKRRARLLGQFVEDVEALVVLESYDGACGICGRDVDPFNFALDHIIPLARGGLHSYANVQPAHKSCNSRKHTKLMDEL